MRTVPVGFDSVLTYKGQKYNYPRKIYNFNKKPISESHVDPKFIKFITDRRVRGLDLIFSLKELFEYVGFIAWVVNYFYLPCNIRLLSNKLVCLLSNNVTNNQALEIYWAYILK